MLKEGDRLYFKYGDGKKTTSGGVVTVNRKTITVDTDISQVGIARMDLATGIIKNSNPYYTLQRITKNGYDLLNWEIKTAEEFHSLVLLRKKTDITHGQMLKIIDILKRDRLMTDEEILEANGWIMECESPLEIRNEESESFATNEAAQIVLYYLKEELKYNINQKTN